MSGGWNAPQHVGICPRCGKRCFTSRKLAKAYGRSHHPSEKLNAYQCGDYWHIGHLNPAVREGRLPRRF